MDLYYLSIDSMPLKMRVKAIQGFMLFMIESDFYKIRSLEKKIKKQLNYNSGEELLDYIENLFAKKCDCDIGFFFKSLQEDFGKNIKLEIDKKNKLEIIK